MKRFLRQLIADILIALIVFLVSLWLHEGHTFQEIRLYIVPAAAYYGFHLLVSLFSGKYEYRTRLSITRLISRYMQCWVISALAALLFLSLYHEHGIARGMILTNIFGLLAGEYLMILVVSLFRESVPLLDPEEITEDKDFDRHLIRFLPAEEEEEFPSGETLLGQPALRKASPVLRKFLQSHFPQNGDSCLVIDTSDSASLLSFPENSQKNIISIHPLNRTRYINHFLEVANSRLQEGGLLVVSAETVDQRRKRIMHKYPPVINRIYYFFDYLLMRVLPKLPPFRKIWYRLTNGTSYVMSRTEIMGRLSATGFAIGEEIGNNGVYCLSGEKKGVPLDYQNATYGPLIHLLRVGQNGKLLKIYKLRTMYPYSEFIQEYVYEHNHLAAGGKFRDDFRVTTLGSFLRRYWLDELPSLWNWMRGDVKLVGVRPLSRHYFSLYSPELQQRRIRVKPGLIPPFYYDLPETLEEIQASEMRYLDAWEKAPLRTDIRYFWRAVYNIVVKGAKSN